ncbi:uncharacterized protein LOC110689651 [Chenopodium quinoa]|uniref:uncharacterized protein LOC110689651 n=1 Tax=Chenopodium quinoa TaxID=63459 RepID=UPI000B776F0F|nr:uncharacterized protein LOC110689651 [Chenopodium quinoa]
MNSMKSLEHFWNKSQNSSNFYSPNSKPISEYIEDKEDIESPNVIQPPLKSNPQAHGASTSNVGFYDRVYDVELLTHDPGKRIPILGVPKNDQDVVRRGYIAKKRCDPRTHNFPQRSIGGMRHFDVDWFDKYECLEYSVEKDAAFCFVCYLFKDKTTSPGGDTFVVLTNAPGNNQMIAPFIQKDLINSCANETTMLLIEDLNGGIGERFLGIVHVGDTTALTLKFEIETLLKENSLILSRVCGQGYDRASNMGGEINGLKNLTMNDTKKAYYVHCFAHQLQLTLVVVAKENDDCIWHF